MSDQSSNTRLLPEGVHWEQCKCGLVRISVERGSVNGGRTGWGCPKCNLERAEKAERQLKMVPDEELSVLLRGAEDSHPDSKLTRLLRELAERRSVETTAPHKHTWKGTNDPWDEYCIVCGFKPSPQRPENGSALPPTTDR